MMMESKKGIDGTSITIHIAREEKQYAKVLNRIIGGLFELHDVFDDEHTMEVMEEVADLIDERLEE